MTCAEETRRRGDEEERKRRNRGGRARGWKTDKDKVRAKVGSWARKWWVVVVRVAATAKDEKAGGGLPRIARGEEGVEG